MAIPGFSTSVSGVRAATTRLEASAHNTANANTDGCQRLRVQHQENAAGGVTTLVTRDATPGVPLGPNSVEASAKVASNVDVAEEVVSSMVAKTSYNANLQLIETHDETLGTLLDMTV